MDLIFQPMVLGVMKSEGLNVVPPESFKAMDKYCKGSLFYSINEFFHNKAYF